MGAGTVEKEVLERGVEEAAAESNGRGEAREPLDGEHQDEQPQGEAPKIPPLVLEGKGQLSLKISGDRPDKATAKMVGGKIEIPAGEYQPGEVIEAVVRLQCRKVSIIDKVDGASGERTEREREHQFRVLQIEKVE